MPNAEVVRTEIGVLKQEIPTEGHKLLAHSLMVHGRCSRCNLISRDPKTCAPHAKTRMNDDKQLQKDEKSNISLLRYLANAQNEVYITYLPMHSTTQTLNGYKRRRDRALSKVCGGRERGTKRR